MKLPVPTLVLCLAALFSAFPMAKVSISIKAAAYAGFGQIDATCLHMEVLAALARYFRV